MTTSRTLTVVTANLGRHASKDKFTDNLYRVFRKVPGRQRVFCFQEIDEADTPDEHRILRGLFGEKDYHFVGWNTHVPIAVPPTWTIKRRVIDVACNGVAELSPRRHVVQAVIAPKDAPNCQVVMQNTHHPRNDKRLEDERRDCRAATAKATAYWQSRELTSVLVGDLNTLNYPTVAKPERRIVSSRLDYIRGYPMQDGASINVLDVGVVDLTIDGHNAHWARLELTWPTS